MIATTYEVLRDVTTFQTISKQNLHMIGIRLAKRKAFAQ